uniref:Uncharacterized protein n=1 Tax=Parascaris univalens TaxID=6257 RepID=A0A914ZE76_PARUN
MKSMFIVLLNGQIDTAQGPNYCYVAMEQMALVTMSSEDMERYIFPPYLEDLYVILRCLYRKQVLQCKNFSDGSPENAPNLLILVSLRTLIDAMPSTSAEESETCKQPLKKEDDLMKEQVELRPEATTQAEPHSSSTDAPRPLPKPRRRSQKAQERQIVEELDGDDNHSNT